jgi:branched-chain amino acid transport system substrate-binding protein
MLTRFDPTYGSSTQHARVAPRNPISYDRSRESLDPTSVAVGLGSVWTTDGSTSLVRTSLDLKRVKYINLGSPLDDVAVGDGAVWALSGPAAKVYRLDRDGHVTVPIPIAPKPGLESPYPIAIAVGAGAVWVLNDNTATVTKIDPAQNLVLATKRLGIQRRPVRIAVGDGAAWVADADGTLARIDATTDQEPQFLPAAGSLRDVAVVGTTVWVTAGPGAGDLAAKSVSASSAPLHALPESFCSPFYSQSGTRPRYLIVGELALQGLGGRFIAQTGEAIQFVLKQHHYRAGGYALGYQSCDSSSAAAGYPTPAKCAADAHAYAADPSVLAVIGAWSSLCTQAELPIANSAPGASLAMISYSNTYIGLTHHGPGTASNEPAKYYPTGTRSYARVIAADDQQGAADAVAARTLGARRVYVLHDTNPYGSGIAADFAAAARRLGLTVIGPALWKFTNVSRFAARVTRSHPDAVFLGTDSSHPENVRLIKDLRSALPRSTLLMAPDGFDANDLVAKAGSAAEGMTVSAVGVSAERLPAAGRRFVNGFEQATGSTAPSTSSIAAAQATEVLLTAIAHSNGTRASVVKELLRTHVSNGILGSFGFDRNGDTTAGAVTIYKIVKGVPRVFRVITPPRNLAR